ncbi:MAG: hypothetical protein NPINA01_32150 [Nitrospinaceae bacterium]|jgi:hypothetical protein|nr:MAG: hypothetical protein NPINA01_32150 [Nitrospinaceae bacterium]
MVAKDQTVNIKNHCGPMVTDFLKEKMGLCKMAFKEVSPPPATSSINPNMVKLAEETKNQLANNLLSKGTGADNLDELRKTRQAQFDAIFKDGPS